jgi:hypothetical protein
VKHRVWVVTITAPCVFLTANDRRHKMAEAKLIKSWRAAAFVAAQVEHLPRGLARVRIDAVAHFRGRPPVRDRSNLSPTLKAVIDGLGPAREIRRKGVIVGTSIGYGLIPDDDDAHLDGPHLLIGDPLPPRAYSGPGELILTITELPA